MGFILLIVALILTGATNPDETSAEEKATTVRSSTLT